MNRWPTANNLKIVTRHRSKQRKKRVLVEQDMPTEEDMLLDPLVHLVACKCILNQVIGKFGNLQIFS